MYSPLAPPGPPSPKHAPPTLSFSLLPKNPPILLLLPLVRPIPL